MQLQETRLHVAGSSSSGISLSPVQPGWARTLQSSVLEAFAGQSRRVLNVIHSFRRNGWR